MRHSCLTVGVLDLQVTMAPDFECGFGLYPKDSLDS